MDAVLGVLSKIGDFLLMIASFLTPIFDALAKHSHLIFLMGFYGLLMAFLWFFFWYLDRKKLVLPTIVFSLFFVIFISGTTLLLFRGDEDQSAAASGQETVEIEESESAESGEQTI